MSFVSNELYITMYEVVKLIVHDITIDIMLYEITLKSQTHLNKSTLHVTCLIVLGVQEIRSLRLFHFRRKGYRRLTFCNKLYENR